MVKGSEVLMFLNSVADARKMEGNVNANPVSGSRVKNFLRETFDGAGFVFIREIQSYLKGNLISKII